MYRYMYRFTRGHTIVKGQKMSVLLLLLNNTYRIGFCYHLFLGERGVPWHPLWVTWDATFTSHVWECQPISAC